MLPCRFCKTPKPDPQIFFYNGEFAVCTSSKCCKAHINNQKECCYCSDKVPYPIIRKNKLYCSEVCFNHYQNDLMRIVFKECPACTKEFMTRLRWQSNKIVPRQTYCSARCALIKHHPVNLKNCYWCRTKFKVRPYRQNFCSFQCLREIRALFSEHRKQTCQNCKVVFGIKLRYRRQKFCSLQCYSIYCQNKK